MKISSDKTVKAIRAATFPAYTGRKFRLHVTDAPINCSSSWDGGSRSFFRFLNLATMEASIEVPAQSAYDTKLAGIDSVTLPVGFACIEHNIFCGKDTGLTIHIRTENSAKLLPAVRA